MLLVVGVVDEGAGEVVVVAGLWDVVVVEVGEALEDPLLELEGAEPEELGVEDVELDELPGELLPLPVELLEPDPDDCVDEDEDELPLELEDLGGLATRPLWFSSVVTSCWTAATWAATAAGRAPAPRAGRAFSCLSACSSLASTAAEGCDFRVITIWSAIAVVSQAGQL